MSKVEPRNNAGLGFGIRTEHNLLRPKDDNEIKERLKKWPDLWRCAVFDSWICNGDRLPNNLLFESDGNFWVIDHDDAMPGYVLPNPEFTQNTKLMPLLAEDKSEIELHRIRNQMMGLVENLKELDWNEIRVSVRHQDITEIRRPIDKYAAFLRSRLDVMHTILTEELGIKQKSIKLSNKNTRQI